jgi:sulfatase modifying factor 1
MQIASVLRVAFVAAGAVVLSSASAAGERSGRIVRVDQHAPREVFVPAGTFKMGVDVDTLDMAAQQCEALFQADQPLQVPTPSGTPVTVCDRYREELDKMASRDVSLDAFAIDRLEISVADYRRCIKAGACSLDAMISGDERYLHDEWPMVNVTWNEAQSFCRWRGGRLPTEAEWERAARGDDERVWPWGNIERPRDFNHGQPRSHAMKQIDRIQTLNPLAVEFMGDPDPTDGYALLAPPGSYPWGEGPQWGGYGTRDQAGNVAEWVADVRGGTDATLGYSSLPSVNPIREGSATDARVVRGGSWRQPALLGRASLRDPLGIVLQGMNLYAPDRRFSHVGFRCARSLR